MATYPLLLPLLAAVAVAAASSAEDTPTAYEMLERYDFPRECEFLLAKQWLVKYDRRIAGAASAGKLAALQGIYVKVLFLWIPVAEVDRAGERLSFYISPVSTSFPLSDFASSPHCRGYHDRAAVAAAVS
ncbi:unnamed protein product [Triticum turgidum subsp. durum]|uniref:Uncharacterized protein n=1 Tax=Triticum turgidum subsp. durum TaxID=4567 RepID=A0A9R0Q8F6_TRITD|nr:unnamed protein product [Triticum turgidum subsp. durum]